MGKLFLRGNIITTRTWRKSNVVLGLTLLSLGALAQPEIELSTFQEKYPDARTVLLDRSEVMEFKVVKGELRITSSNILQELFLNDKNVTSRSERIPYDPLFVEIDHLEAATYKHLPNGFRKIRVTEFTDIQDVNGSSFYDSRRFKKFRYPSLEYGSVSECKYTYSILSPQHLGGFRFQYGVPAEKVELKVIVPNNVEIGTFEFGDMSMVKYTTEVKGKNTIHTWRAMDVPEFKGSDFIRTADGLIPEIYVYIKSFTHKKETERILGSKDELYQLSYGYLDGVFEEPNDHVKGIVDSILTATSTEEEAVKGIFYWVQDHIRYIAFEDGMGGVVPRKANLVCDRKYGDCKDMATLIKTMLDYGGIPGYLCWIGSDEIGFSVDELPLPYAHNHMIAVYKKGDEYIYLDATSKRHKFGMPSRFIQGQQAMIGISPDEYDTPFVPFVAYEDNIVTDDFEVSIEGSGLKLKGHAEMTGYIKSSNEYRFESAGQQKEEKVWLDILERGNNKCKLLSYEVENLYDRDSALVVDYELLIQDYIREIDNEMYVNLNLDRSITAMKPDTADRSWGAYYSFMFQDHANLKFEIPTAYKVTSVPDDLVINKPLYDIEIKYTLEAQKILVTKVFNFKTDVIPYDKIQEWIADLDLVTAAYRQTVVLQKN